MSQLRTRPSRPEVQVIVTDPRPVEPVGSRRVNPRGGAVRGRTGQRPAHSRDRRRSRRWSVVPSHRRRSSWLVLVIGAPGGHPDHHVGTEAPVQAAVREIAADQDVSDVGSLHHPAHAIEPSWPTSASKTSSSSRAPIRSARAATVAEPRATPAGVARHSASGRGAPARSNSRIAAAVATLSESARPRIEMRTRVTAASRHGAETPAPSEPTTMATRLSS